MTFYDVLNVIQTNSLVIMLTAVAFALFKHRKTSFVITVAIVCAVNILHISFQLGMNILFESESFTGVIYDISIRAWYLFFALTDFGVAVFVYLFLGRLSLKPDYKCHVIAICYTILGFIQLCRYADRFVLGYDFCILLYQNGIPLVNVFVLLITLSGVVSDCSRNQKEK